MVLLLNQGKFCQITFDLFLLRSALEKYFGDKLAYRLLRKVPRYIGLLCSPSCAIQAKETGPPTRVIFPMRFSAKINQMLFGRNFLDLEATQTGDSLRRGSVAAEGRKRVTTLTFWSHSATSELHDPFSKKQNMLIFRRSLNKRQPPSRRDPTTHPTIAHPIPHLQNKKKKKKACSRLCPP